MSNKQDVEVEWFVKEQPKEKCAACGCDGPLTLHHLVPQVTCRNKYKEVKDDPSNHVMLCSSCHSQIHALFDENQLRDRYCTLEALLAAPEFKKYVEWKKKHPDFDGSSKMSNGRKGKLKR